MGTDDNRIHYLRFNNWIWSAHFASNPESEGFVLVLNVVRREKSDHPNSSFAAEAALKDIHVSQAVMSASGKNRAVDRKELVT